MANNVTFKVSSGAFVITVGGGNTSASNLNSGTGDPGQPSGYGRGGPEEGGCCPVVIGPILVPMGWRGAETGGGDPGQPSGYGSGDPGEPSGYGKGDPGQPSGYGRGGPGEGCCCPVAIGPIVFTDCGSAAAAYLAEPAVCSQAYVEDPPEHVQKPQAPFKMQRQENGYWCWAAVAASIHNAFNPGHPLKQAEVAATLLHVNCKSNPHACEQGAPLDAALQVTGNLMPDGYLRGKHLTYESLQKWGDQSLPVALRIQWRGTGGHFIAVDGCFANASGDRLVFVKDPLRQADDPQADSVALWDYDALVEDYDGFGCWESTYLVQSAR